MRPALALVAATLTMLSIACSSTSSGAGNGGGGGGGGGGGAGNCESACVYYLQCKGADTPQNRADCNNACTQQGYTSQQLADFQKMSCADAVSAIEGGRSGSGGGGGGGGGTKDCYNCQWDGSSCIYIAPGGGAYSQCDPSCC